MANPFGGTNILGCNSPALGPDKNRFTEVIDTLAESLDGHDHSSGKGVPLTTGSIADGAIDVTKIDDLQVTPAKIDDDAVTTAKIDDGAVTPVKRSSVNRVVSGGDDVVIDLTGLNNSVEAFPHTAVITATGNKPVRVEFRQGGEGSGAVFEDTLGGHFAFFTSGSSATTLLGELQLFRNSVMICKNGVGLRSVGTPGVGISLTPTSFCFTDTAPVAGVNTYELKFKAPPGVGVDNTLIFYTYDMTIVAYEM